MEYSEITIDAHPRRTRLGLIEASDFRARIVRMA